MLRLALVVSLNEPMPYQRRRFKVKPLPVRNFHCVEKVGMHLENREERIKLKKHPAKKPKYKTPRYIASKGDWVGWDWDKVFWQS
jgi:hypothetical protein